MEVSITASDPGSRRSARDSSGSGVVAPPWITIHRLRDSLHAIQDGMDDFVTSTERLWYKPARLAKQPSAAMLRRAGRWCAQLLGVAIVTVLVAAIATAASICVARIFAARPPSYGGRRYPARSAVPTTFGPYTIKNRKDAPATKATGAEKA